MTSSRQSIREIFTAFLRLGLTSFGGPIAHLGYFRSEFVERRRWLDDAAYADLVALCQFLPGPASSEVGLALGLFRGGYGGAVAAWAGFTLPSALALAVFGLMLGHAMDLRWLHGLMVVAVAVVAQALWGMGKSLCSDRFRASIAVCAALMATAIPGPLGQIAVIIGGGVMGGLWLAPGAALPHSPFPLRFGRTTGLVALVIYALLLAVLPLVAARWGNPALHLADSFYRTGALVFGGGHVVLPLLQAETVPSGMVPEAAFLAGYGAAQAVPGPLFTFAAYLGAVAQGWRGAAIALIAIFLPAFLLVIGALPLWEQARRHPMLQRAMQGINAAVVGLLLAAFYNPVWINAIQSTADFTLAVSALLLLMAWKVPPWAVVALCAAASAFGWS